MRMWIWSRCIFSRGIATRWVMRSIALPCRLYFAGTVPGTQFRLRTNLETRSVVQSRLEEDTNPESPGRQHGFSFYGLAAMDPHSLSLLYSLSDGSRQDGRNAGARYNISLLAIVLPWCVYCDHFDSSWSTPNVLFMLYAGVHGTLNTIQRSVWQMLVFIQFTDYFL